MMEELRSRFPERLKQIRLGLGLNQGDMAAKIGVSRAAYSMYETGKNLPDIALIDNLHQFTGYPFSYLMGYTDNYTDITAGIDHTLGLSTEAIEKMQKYKGIQAVINHWLESPLAGQLAQRLRLCNEACRENPTLPAWASNVTNSLIDQTLWDHAQDSIKAVFGRKKGEAPFLTSEYTEDEIKETLEERGVMKYIREIAKNMEECNAEEES